MNINEVIKEYLEWKGTYAPRASINYKIWLFRFVQVCGVKTIEQYKVTDIVNYRKWLESRFNPYTVQFATVVIKNFFQFCKTQNYLCLAPTLIRLPRINAKSHRAVTEKEYNSIISGIPINEFKFLRDVLLLRMLWDTGIRVSELCDIDISSINESKRLAVIQTKKTGKKRIIVWSGQTHKLLMKYMTLRQKLNNRSALFVGWKNGLGWTQRLTCRSVERIVKYYVSQAGIKEKITPHSFRHGWAHKRRDQNAPLAFIQRGLGHQNPVSTFIYEQYNDLDFERKANRYLSKN